MGYVIMSSATICSFVYIFRNAKNFDEYTQSTYICSACILICIALQTMIFNVKKLFELINWSENIVNTRELILYLDFFLFSFANQLNLVEWILQRTNFVRQNQVSTKPIN